MIGNLLLAIGLSIGVGVGGISNSHWFDQETFASKNQLRIVDGINYTQAFNFYFNDYFDPNFGSMFYCVDSDFTWYTMAYTENWYNIDTFMQQHDAVFGFNLFTSSTDNVVSFSPCWRSYLFNYNGKQLLNNCLFVGFEISNGGFGTHASISYKKHEILDFTFSEDEELFDFWYQDTSSLFTSYGNQGASNGSGCLLGLDYTIVFYGLDTYVDDENQWNVGFGAFVPSDYQDNYSIGFHDGYIQGYKDGESAGSITGYDKGYADGIGTAQRGSFFNLFGALADTPLRMLYSLFSFDLFGMSALAIVLSFLTGIFVIKIIKKFL